MSIGPTLENSLQCAPDARFSPPLFQLKHLQSLTFFKCFPPRRAAAAALPDQPWTNLAGSLETLEFRSNEGLLGKLPPSLCELRRLRSLVVIENGLSGELPAALGGLAALQRLVLSGNNFSGEIPAVDSSMADLLILDLSRNSFSGPIPESLGGLRGLLKLDLSSNFLSEKIPPQLGKMKSLTLLDLRKNRLSGGIPTSIDRLVDLQELLLSENPLGGEIEGLPWEKMKGLEAVDLSNAGLCGPLPSAMAELPELRSLRLNNNNLSGAVKFPEEFFARLGRGFSAWGNPNLCYSTPSRAPPGLKVCKELAVAVTRGKEASGAAGFLSLDWVLLCLGFVFFFFSAGFS
ncbi:uncharacterized protein LOC144709372 isoform X2 [Wolffia australiana]